MHFERCLAWFQEYTVGFRTRAGEDVRHIDHKIDHSLRVLDEVRELVEGLGLPTRLAELAAVAALLHDTGRFRQFERYRTFFDARSVNHGLLGVKALKDEGVLRELAPGERRVVLTAVALHNRFRLPVRLPLEASLVTNLVRDADKLDIVRATTAFLDTGEDEVQAGLFRNFDPDPAGVSDEVVRTLSSGRLPPRSLRVYANDQILLILGWIHDLHFDVSVARMLDQGLVDRLIHHLPLEREEVAALADGLRTRAMARASAPVPPSW